MNEAITVLLSLAVLILWLAALLGLLVPRWVFQPTRLRGVFVPLALSVLALIGLGMVPPQPPAADPAPGTPSRAAAAPTAAAPTAAAPTAAAPTPRAERPQVGARDYQVIEAVSTSMPGRKRVRWSIVAPAAQTLEDRAYTAIQAAKDLHQHTEAAVVIVWLEPAAEVKGSGLQVARVTYIPDGKGLAGRDEGGRVWSVSASSATVDAQGIAITRAMLAQSEALLAEFGDVDDKLLAERVAEQLDIPPDHARFPAVPHERFEYSGRERYRVLGKRLADTVAEPAIFARPACAMDLECWSQRHRVAGTVACRAAVEAQALYAFEWQSSVLRPRFPEVRWWNEDQGSLLFVGNAIRFQNAFGGWIDHNYACAYDPETDTVIEAAAAPRSSP